MEGCKWIFDAENAMLIKTSSFILVMFGLYCQGMAQVSSHLTIVWLLPTYLVLAVKGLVSLSTLPVSL